MRTLYKAGIEKVKGKNVDVVKKVNVEKHQIQQFLDQGWVADESGEPAPVQDLSELEGDDKPDPDAE
jgi:hypothetical protein